MKRVVGLILLIIAIPRLSNGQSATPEFELKLHYSDPGGGGISNPVGFGYDPAAKIVTEDSTDVDTEFGEFIAPLITPGGPGSFEELFELDPMDGGYIDILPKPDSNSFILQYTFYLSPFQPPATLSWDRSQIPSAIKSITISPAGAPFLIMADMTKQDSVVIDDINPTDTNYYTNWDPAIITLYYNSGPDAVSPTPNLNTGFLSDLIAYPNPMTERGSLSFSLSDPSSVIVTGYDAIGREVLRVVKSEPAGENMLDLSGLTNAHGAILLRVEASSGSTSETKSVMLVKE